LLADLREETTMDVYEKFDAAFRGISAYAILRDGKPVGRVAIKHGGRCTVYLQAWGAPMVTAYAGGGGYDRATAAMEKAASLLACDVDAAWPAVQAVKDAILSGRDGYRWTSRLEAAGFTIANVIC
jgi:hypothetical protein